MNYCFVKNLVILLSFLLTAQVCVYGQKKKENITTPVTLTYSLPKVQYRSVVKMKCTQLIPGPYSKYAEEMLGEKAKITRRAESWELINFVVSTEYVADPQNTFTIRASGEYTGVLLSLTPQGILTGVNMATSPSVMPKMKVSRKVSLIKEADVDAIEISKIPGYNPMKEVLDSNFTIQNVDGVDKKIWDPRISYEKKSEEDNVREAAKIILDLRSDRQDLLASKSMTPDYVKASLENIDRREKQYLELFEGKSVSYIVEKDVITTVSKEAQSIVLFRFSQDDGLADLNNVGATPCVMKLSNLTIVNGNDKSSDTGDAVVNYRVPATADVSIVYGQEILDRFTAIIPQLGTLKSFPLDVIGNEDLQLKIDPRYGSLDGVSRK